MLRTRRYTAEETLRIIQDLADDESGDSGGDTDTDDGDGCVAVTTSDDSDNCDSFDEADAPAEPLRKRLKIQQNHPITKPAVEKETTCTITCTIYIMPACCMYMYM